MKYKLFFIFLSFMLLIFSNAFAQDKIFIPAENYDANLPGQGSFATHTFDQTDTATGFYGSGYMIANFSGDGGDGSTTDRIQLRYNVDFATAGTYYLWVRVYFPSTDEDSFFYGTDSVNNGDQIAGSPRGVWSWRSVSIDIGTAGQHTIDFFGREPNVLIDHLVVTSDDAYDPNNANLIHSYTFEDGTANDVVGGANGVLQGDAAVADGQVTLSGTGFVSLPGKTINVPLYPGISVESVFRQAPGVSGFTTIYNFGETYASNNLGVDYILWQPTRADHVSRTSISCLEYSTPWANENGVNADEINDAYIHHEVTVITESEIKLYLDGILAGTADLTGNNSLANVSNDTAYIGKAVYAGDPLWQGSVDELNIYSGELSAEEISARADAFVPKRIVFVSRPGKDNPDTPEEADADKPFTDDLIAEGYEVNTVYSSSLANASQGLVDTLNNADLVIIGRSGDSPDFGSNNIADRAAWNNISAPILNLHLWTARNSRLNWLPTGTTSHNDAVGDTISAKIELPDDPVFADATIATDSTMDWVITPSDYMATTDGGNGTVLARDASDSNVLFVRWDPWVYFYSGAGDFAAGYRTLIGNGNDNVSGSFNYYNFTDEAKQVYLNEVARMASLEKVERPVKKVAYVTNAEKQADLVEGAAPVDDDPIIRILKADDNFEVDVLAVAPDSVVDLSGYDVVVAQESFNSSSAIFRPGGSLGLANISVPFLYNKMYALRDGRGFQDGAAGSGAEIEGTFTIDVDPANQGNDLFKGLTFENNQLTLFSGGADDDGGDSRNKGLNYATGVVLSDTTTLLGIQTGAPAEATVGINDIPAGTTIGSETLQARMITVGFNFGAIVRNDGSNLTSAGLTIWRNAVYSLAGLYVPTDPVVNIKSDPRNIPIAYTLGQNYPNPFNPVTKIQFSLPKAGRTTLKIYNTLGQLVSTIVDEEMNAGVHTITFKAGALASGVYFYRIESGDFSRVKKMMLLK